MPAWVFGIGLHDACVYAKRAYERAKVGRQKIVDTPHRPNFSGTPAVEASPKPSSEFTVSSHDLPALLDPKMPHSKPDGPLAKRQKVSSAVDSAKPSANSSRIFAPFRTVGLVSPTSVPFASIPLGKTTFQITTSVGRSLQTYDLRRGLNLVFVTRPQTPADITATFAWKEKVLAAWGGSNKGEPQGVWVFQRGIKVGELPLPPDFAEPIRQILVFGTWIVAAASTRIEIFKSVTLEHYTTIHTMAAGKGGNEITGGITNMPTFLNKIFVGRKDGWVEIWNVSTGKLIYTILPPSSDCGSVTCLEPSPALSLMAIAYSGGPLVITNVLTDKRVLQVEAGNPEAPVNCISFRTDGVGAGQDGRKSGVMATTTAATGDVTFWDLNGGGRIMGVLRSAHNPPSRDGLSVRGGLSKVEFLVGQPVIVTSGRDNSLKSWIFDTTPFSPVPRILHSRSGHAGPVNCLQFLPTDFDGSEAGNKWLLSGGQDRSLWGWSLRRDGQSTELSQGNVRKLAKKVGILATNALAHGPTTSLEDLKAPEITCIATSLNRDGGIGAIPGKQPMWQKGQNQSKATDAESSGMTGWESVVTAHKGDPHARTWFWGRKRAGRWAFPTGDGTNVSTVAISPCGTFAVVGSERGCIDMHNLQSGQCRQRFPSRLTPSQARQLRLQQLKQADDVAQLQSETGRKFPPGTGKHTKAVTGIVVDSMNKFIVSCSLDGKIKFWDFLTGTLLEQIDWAPMTAPIACRYHAANNLLAFACDDMSIRVVDMETKKTIRELWGPQDTINDVCFSNDGRWVIAASRDQVIRVWDLPTSHLIDAIRLEKPCTALSMSTTGEYLAATIQDEPGVTIWTNKSLFKHVPTRQISEMEIGQISAPTVSGEGNQGLLEGAFDDDQQETDDAVVVPAIDQLSSDMMTLSLVPKSRWQTLLHLDLIKERNKPKEPPKAPEKAPFFLPSSTGAQAPGQERVGETQADEAKSRITKLDQARFEEIFSTKLRRAAATNNYDEFIEHLKSLSPSSADLELRSLSVGDGADDSNELLHFIRALTARLKARRDYELTQAWMTVFLRLHFDVVMESETLLAALEKWKSRQELECSRLDDLVGYCSGVVNFLRSPRT
ncbi:U3 small nucleolar RNA-associated protein 21 [Tolypocladium capitatum]|uniref:U3 small nucleolar RNA-associated protein 21 n=1 Tax=Tolypocladium capitatum TaxID=45235 RepID=A0A2K3QKR3_9HYPO|nr:U3 small nucleolar RNA-associated protein 21 [Tolypocladium capitatum]